MRRFRRLLGAIGAQLGPQRIAGIAGHQVDPGFGVGRVRRPRHAGQKTGEIGGAIG